MPPNDVVVSAKLPTYSREAHYSWERRANESPQAWGAFVAYRDIGVYRDIRSVCRAIGKGYSTLSGWSVTHEWVSRVAAYDAWCDVESRKQKEAERRKALATQLKLGTRMMELADSSMVAKMGSDTPSLDDKDVPNYAKTGRELVDAALGADPEAAEQVNDELRAQLAQQRIELDAMRVGFAALSDTDKRRVLDVAERELA